MVPQPQLSTSNVIADASKIAPLVFAKDLVLPVPDVFQQVLPGSGLQRGWTTRIEGFAAGRAFAWALLSEVTRTGGWIAALDVAGIGLLAASEVGLSIERVLVVTSSDSDGWTEAMSALIGSVDVIVFGTPQHRVTPSMHRRLSSRCRERGTVLMELGTRSNSRQSRDSSVQADVTFGVSPVEWKGIGEGHGRVEARTLRVTTSGRRSPGKPRSGLFCVPDIDGIVRPVPASTEPVLSVV